MSALPTPIPIFPLPGVLLLPHADLPLHIFEPRYRAMMRDALDGAGSIAMIQPNGAGPDPANPPVYRTGCLGRIKASERFDDGRFNLVLTGVCRFDVVDELPLHPDGYRRVVPDYERWQGDLREPAPALVDRDRLLAALRSFLSVRNLGADWETIGRLDDRPLVDTLSAICPFRPAEKQALLESADVPARARMLTSLCEMGALVANDDEPRH